MTQRHFEIGVIVARKRLESPWADRTWLPHAVLSATPATQAGTPLGTYGRDELFYAGSAELTLHSSATSQYRDNLTSGRPSTWVFLRLIGSDAYEVSAVTADPSEGEALAEGIGGVVEAVPMPEDIQAKVAAFFDAFHVERPFVKRERSRVDPEALATRLPMSRPQRENDNR